VSFGGGKSKSKGLWTQSVLTNLDSNITRIKQAGWDGIVYVIKEGDPGLSNAFAKSFANAKAEGLSILVSVSNSQPYRIPDASLLMTGFISDSNIDYLSPQLFRSGNEPENDYTDKGTTWASYTSAKAKFVPSVVNFVRDCPTAASYFDQFRIQVYGCVQWAQGFF